MKERNDGRKKEGGGKKERKNGSKKEGEGEREKEQYQYQHLPCLKVIYIVTPLYIIRPDRSVIIRVDYSAA